MAAIFLVVFLWVLIGFVVGRKKRVVSKTEFRASRASGRQGITYTPSKATHSTSKGKTQTGRSSLTCKRRWKVGCLKHSSIGVKDQDILYDHRRYKTTTSDCHSSIINSLLFCLGIVLKNETHQRQNSIVVVSSKSVPSVIGRLRIE